MKSKCVIVRRCFNPSRCVAMVLWFKGSESDVSMLLRLLATCTESVLWFKELRALVRLAVLYCSVHYTTHVLIPRDLSVCGRSAVNTTRGSHTTEPRPQIPLPHQTVSREKVQDLERK